jgi:hypothetical protein
VAHNAADCCSARVTESHIIVVLVPMIRTTAFACRYKNKLALLTSECVIVATSRLVLLDF